MGELLIGTLPFALGAAVSPTVLTVVVLILASGERALRRTWLFALGGMAFTAVFIIVCRTLLTGITQSGSGPDSLERVIEAILALAVVVLAVLPFVRRRPPDPGPSRVQRMLSSDHSGVFIGLGVVTMVFNASTLIVVLAGSHHITEADASLTATTLAAVMLFVGAVLPLVLPPLMVTIAGHRADAFLAKLNTFTATHQRVINTTILLLIAALLVYKAIT